ncbi:MAG TPA: glycoside hydrolase family 3 C-terminal domain-containing protein [Polyangiaceae bacterium]|nr:glycoside hydrolase family 3 C-terminal domain-containing protein [Polyangiaceae bacterium]
MRRQLLLPLCLLTTFGCEGRYVLGNVLGHAGASNSDSSAGSGNATSSHAGNDAGTNNPGTGGSGMVVDGSGTATTGTGGSGAGPQFACGTVGSQQFDLNYMQAYSVSAEVTAQVTTTLNAMSPADKASQMLGLAVGQMDYFDIERSPDIDVPGIGTILGYNYRDGDHGVNLDAGQPNNRKTDGKDYSTAFPSTSVRAASWDLALEKRVGEAIGDEVAASRNNLLVAPTMNIVRHPYWGRTQETYGEDSYHIGRMATAFTIGLQEYVVGCASHFAANNIEKNRTNQDAIMNEQTLREIYGRHFEMVIQDGAVGCVLASYNKINGVKSTQNKHLLRDILKAPVSAGGFGFQGFVLSDWWAMPGDQNLPDASSAQSTTNEALRAGLDVEVPWTLHYSTTTLANVDQSLVTDAARRVLTQKYRFKTAKTTDPGGLKQPTSTLTGSSIVNSNHEDLAEEVELKSAVLLTNGVPNSPSPVLPLTSVTKIAVVGPDQVFSLISSTVPKTCTQDPQRGPCTFHFATDVALGDRGSNRVNADPARSIGPFAGIAAAAGNARQVTSGNSAAAAADADAIVVVVGYTPGDEGEEYAIGPGGDRSSLDLPIPSPFNIESIDSNAFVNSVLDLNKPTIIVVESGSVVNLPWLSHSNKNQATVWAGYGGMRGGAALGKLIFGMANFSGKMPMAWPTQAELDKAAFKGDDDQGTQMGYFFGYREYDRRKAAGNTVNLVFPFGHGLSYSTFAYSNLQVPCTAATKDAIIDVTVDIKNTSAVDGDETAMLFVKPPAKPANITGDRPVKELKSFSRVSVKAGQTVTAHLPVRVRDLRRWEGAEGGKWVIDSGTYTLLVGKNADDAETSAVAGQVVVQGG